MLVLTNISVCDKIDSSIKKGLKNQHNKNTPG